MNAFPYSNEDDVERGIHPMRPSKLVVIAAADPGDIMHDQLDALILHSSDGDTCGCRSAEMHARTCDRLNWVRALLLEPFSELHPKAA